MVSTAVRFCVCVALVGVALAVGAAEPAWASHDDYGAGTVVLIDRAGPTGRVVVVYPPDADEAAAVAEVHAAASAHGIELRDVSAAQNTDPDTLRVSAATPLGERTGFLTRRIPAGRIGAWTELAEDGAMFLRLQRRADAEGLRRVDGAIRLTQPQDVTYRISAWVLALPLLLLVGAAVVPYAAIRLYAARVTSRGGTPEDQLHRLRRAALVVQLVAPVSLIAVLFAGGAMDWADVALAEIAPGADLPQPVMTVVGLLGLMVPFIAAVVSTVLAVLPYDRRLRSTGQSSRAGAGQAVRMLLVIFAPMVLWLTLISALPRARGWVVGALAVLFLAAVTVLQPLVMRAMVKTRPLDEDRRRRVLQLCSEQGLSVRDARMIDSRGGKVANAAISGILPQLRYVYLTDHIVEILTDDELDAVVAHEIAHGKEHHILIKVIAGLVPMVALFVALMAGDAAVGAWLFDVLGPIGLVLVLPALVAVVMLLTHGTVGVALEKRADDRAVDMSGAAALARALGKLADANLTKRRTGWLWNVLQQHPGMEQRIARLEGRVPAA